MSSKINGVDNGRAAPVGPGRAVERIKDTARGDKDGASADATGVDITGAARHLARLEQSLASQPAVDEARVAQVRAALEQGSYKVSPERIADGLVQIERALGHLES